MVNHCLSSPTDPLFALLRSSLWGQARFPFSPDPNTDWAGIWKELRSQAVHLLPVELIAQADPGNSTAYFHAAAINTQKWFYLMEEQQRLCGILQDANIPCAVLKGATVDQYYPQPANRGMGDIDLLVHPQDFETALALLISPDTRSKDEGRHTMFKSNGIRVELHRAFAKTGNVKMDRLLDATLLQALPRAQIRSIDGFSFPALPEAENGLVLLAHLNSHMDGTLGLRQIIDWMLFAHRKLSDEYWEQVFLPLIKPLELESLAKAMTRMCQLYLGLDETISWCRKVPESLCHELMAFILQQGNFGRKQPKEADRAITTLRTAKNLPAFFRLLQQFGYGNWAAAQKHPWLRPFSWIYQICHYIRVWLSKKNPLRYLRGTFQEKRRRDRLMKQLHVTRIRTRDLH